jgi:hypothetical protein
MDESPPSLEDDLVKLVAYTIVSVKRDEERVMPGGEGTIVFTESMTGAAFVSWIIARYMQSETYRKDAYRGLTGAERERKEREERKYLRVYYVVSHTWPREPMKFEEREVEALAEIRDALGGAA